VSLTDLIQAVEEATEIRRSPLEVRQDVCLWISQWLARARKVRGLPPLDDPIEPIDEPAGAFQRIKEILLPQEDRRSKTVPEQDIEQQIVNPN
jgi:hypothetical protein